jgi:hypothetical protein
MESVWLTGRQIEAARVALTRHMKREGQVWIKVFPDKPVTSKPAEVRMGKGKGSLDHWVAVCHAGRIIFEVDGVPMRHRQGGPAPGGAEAADQDQVRDPRGLRRPISRSAMKKKGKN